MQHTTSHELSQWAETDRILREDFNSDNAKIESALEALNVRSGLQLIQSWEVEASFRSIPIDLRSIQWAEWKAIHLDVIPAAGTSANVLFCYNGISEVISRISLKWNHVALYPMGSPDMPIMGLYWCDSCGLFRSVDWITFQGIGYFQLMGETINDLVAAGTKVLVRGERL